MNDSRDRSLPGLLPVERALVAALFWADERGWIPLSKTPILLAVGWASMWLRGVTTVSGRFHSTRAARPVTGKPRPLSAWLKRRFCSKQ